MVLTGSFLAVAGAVTALAVVVGLVLVLVRDGRERSAAAREELIGDVLGELSASVDADRAQSVDALLQALAADRDRSTQATIETVATPPCTNVSLKALQCGSQCAAVNPRASGNPAETAATLQEEADAAIASYNDRVAG